MMQVSYDPDQYRDNFPSRFSNNSKTFASELLENLEELFHQYYMDSNVLLVTSSLGTFLYRIVLE